MPRSPASRPAPAPAPRPSSVGADGMSDAADVSPGVEVATTRRIVVGLDPPDDRLPDARPPADLGDGETGRATRFGQGFPNAHAAPPPFHRAARCPPSRNAGGRDHSIAAMPAAQL